MRHWTYCWKVVSTTTETIMVARSSRGREPVYPGHNMEPPNGYMWSGRSLTNVQARVFMVRGEVKNVVKLSTKGRKKCAFEQPKLDNARKLRGMFLHRSGRHGVQGHHEKRAHKVGDATGTGHGMYDWH